MTAPLKQVHRSLFHGRTMLLRFTVTRGGSPLDLTSAKFTLTAKRDVKDADIDAVFQVTSATNSAPTTGVFEMEIPKTATATVALAEDSEDLVYDVVVEDSASKTYTVETGILTVFPSPTKAEELA